MKLLIVEDNCRMREMISSLMADIADELHECGDGTEALAAYARHHPDWVLMDVKMKEMNGIAATREIVASFPEAHVMIVSNYDDMELREAAQEAGACGYTVKDDLMSLRSLLADAKRNSLPKAESHLKPSPENHLSAASGSAVSPEHLSTYKAPRTCGVTPLWRKETCSAFSN